MARLYQSGGATAISGSHTFQDLGWVMFPDVKTDGRCASRPAAWTPLYLREMPVRCAEKAGFPQHGYVPELAEVA